MFAALLISFAVLTSAPTDTIRVGEPSLLTTLTPGVVTMDNYVIRNGKRMPIVTFVQTITEVPEGYQIVQENMGHGKLMSLDTIVVAKGTLTTVWHADKTPGGKQHIVFGKGHIMGVAEDTAGNQTRINVDIPTGLFDYSIMTLVADHLPLKAGYKAVIATYDITQGPVYVPIRVTGMETLDLDGSTYDTWKMEVNLGRVKVARWVERNTRTEVKWSVTFNGRQMIGLRHSK